MQSSADVGLSLISKAHWGVLLSCALLGVSLIFIVNLSIILMNFGFGGLTGLLLLAYWRGKGGLFFILALISPLIAVLFTPLSQLVEIAPLVASFFLGLSIVLSAFNLMKKNKSA